MDVSLTPEQEEWKTAAARLAAGYAVTGADMVGDLDLARGWAAVLELGIPALRSAAHTGVEAAGVERALAVEQAARRLSPLPIAGQAVIGPELLHAAGATEALDAVIEGRVRFAPALAADLSDFATLGAPAVAFDADGADHALVIDDRHGQRSLVAVPIDATGDGLDLTRQLAPIGPHVAPVALEFDLGGAIAPETLERARAVALTALAADLVGVMDGALADAVAYARDREQFGVPIGSFQAVQHLLADALVALEGSRGCMWHAAWSSDHEQPADALLAARTAKAYCSESGVRVVEATVQAFGGIAITWEHLSHLRLRRVHLDRECLGSEHVHHRAIAAGRIGARVGTA